MNLADVVLFAFIASLLSLDQMACFQVLLSRPVVTASILGLFFGNMTDAIVVGLSFELLFCRAIPLNQRAADPTLAVAAVLAGMWGLSPDIDASAIAAIPPLAVAPYAAAMGLAAAFLSKWFDFRLRDVNTALYHRIHRVGYVQLSAIGAFFAKSFVMYLLTILAVQGALPRIFILIGPSTAVTAAALAWMGMLSVCLAYTTSTFFQSSTSLLWAAGLVVGLLEMSVARMRGMSDASVTFLAAGFLIFFMVFEMLRVARRKPSPV